MGISLLLTRCRAVCGCFCLPLLQPIVSAICIHVQRCVIRKDVEPSLKLLDVPLTANDESHWTDCRVKISACVCAETALCVCLQG